MSLFIPLSLCSWLESLGVNPDGRAGRGLVMASNSFAAVVSIQTMIAFHHPGLLRCLEDGIFGTTER